MAEQAMIDALRLAERFLDKANALACGEYRGSVEVLARRLAEVRDVCRAALTKGDTDHDDR